MPTGRVLVVDDDDAFRHMLCTVLAAEGYAVREASDGAQALAIAREWSPHVILLDLMLPKADGLAFRDEQRKRQDAAAVVTKPFDIDALLQTVEGLTRD